MNWVCIVIGLLFLICVIVGWVQGLFRVIVSVAGLVISIVAATYLAPNISGYLQEHTKIDDNIAVRIEEKLEFPDKEETSKGVQVAVIQELPLPEGLKLNILDNNNSEMYSALEVGGIYEYIAKSIAVVFLNAAVFLLLILVCRVFIYSLGKAMGGLGKLPILRSIDKIGGGMLGALRGLIIVWILFLILSVTSTMEWSQNIIDMAVRFPIFKLLYDNNLLLDIVSDLTKVLFL